MKEFWNARYAESEYVYGKQPNSFFAEQLEKLPAGKLLLPAEGEGRNAVFAAKQGWDVTAFDASEEGRRKAIKLAGEENTTFDYHIQDADSATFPENSFNVVALIYAHFPPELRTGLHQKSVAWLKSGGKIILEAFNPEQLGNASGGPKNLKMLYDLNSLKQDFRDLDIQLLSYANIVLAEGEFHSGMANVVRLVAQKK